MNIFKWKSVAFGIFLFFSMISRANASDLYLERPLGFRTLNNGNVLMADGGGIDWTNNGSHIFEVDESKEIVWNYTDDVIFAHSIDIVSDNEVLVSDTTNNRVIIIDKTTNEVVWTTEDFLDLQLQYPNNAQFTSDSTILITDRNNDRFIEITKSGRVLFEYTELDRPHGAEKTRDGHYLVSDSEGNRVLKMNQQKEIVWEYSGEPGAQLNWPRDIDELDNGNFLITDSRNHRIVEVDKEKLVVWEYKSDLYWPYEAERLSNGATRISDSQQKRIVDIDTEGNVVNRIEFRRNESISEALNNGGFEEVGTYTSTCNSRIVEQCNLLQDNTAPHGWHPGVLHAENNAVLSVDTTDPFEGKHSAKIKNSGDSLVFWQTKFNVVPGKTYVVEGMLKKQGNAQVRYAVLWENELGGFIGEPQVTDEIDDDEWQAREVIVEAPPGAVYANIRALIQGEGSAWFDRVSVSQNIFLAHKTRFATIVGIVAGLIVSWLLFRKK